MNVSDFKALLARKGKCPTCGRGGKRHKFGAVAVVDPETGTRIPSKHEMKVLARKRLEADAEGWITALHPRFRVEGGRYEADVALIEIDTTVPPFADGWNEGRVRFVDAKGRQTRGSAKSIKQVLERYGVRVQIVR